MNDNLETENPFNMTLAERSRSGKLQLPQSS